MSTLESHQLLKESLLTQYSERDSHLAWLYVEKRFDTPDTNSEVWRLKEEWLRISIPDDIGNNTKTVHTLGLNLSVVNARLPPRSRYTDCESAERILYLIMLASAHLSQAVALKLNASTERPHLHAAADCVGPHLDEGPAPRDTVLRRALGGGNAGRIYCKDLAL